MFENLKGKANEYRQKYEEAQKSVTLEMAEMKERMHRAFIRKDKAVSEGDASEHKNACAELDFVCERLELLKKMQKNGAVTVGEYNALIRETQAAASDSAKEVYARMYGIMRAWQEACAELDKIDADAQSVAYTLSQAVPEIVKAGVSVLQYERIYSVKTNNLNVFPSELRAKLSARAKIAE